ncbi:hypothetical protein PZA11_000195 [Diplocarpon coronariae]
MLREKWELGPGNDPAGNQKDRDHAMDVLWQFAKTTIEHLYTVSSGSSPMFIKEISSKIKQEYGFLYGLKLWDVPARNVAHNFVPL